MTNLGVGKEVLSYCGKCKLTLAHLIVNIKSNESIGKVKCKTCDATHAYKDPSKVKASRVKNKSTAPKSKNKNDSISEIWLEAVNSSTNKSQDYSIKTDFKVQDIINHVTFGPGVVQRLIDKNKIEVVFRHQVKILVHNK